MDPWRWLIFTLAVPLASSTAGAQFAAATDAPDTTATALLPTADPDHSASTQNITTKQSITAADDITTTLVPATVPDISTTAQNITTLIPEGSTLTTIPGDTSPAVEITFLTTASNSTTVTQEGSTLTTISGGTTLTIESTFVSTTTTPTIVPTTISPGDTSISPGGTTVIIDATTVSPGGTTLNPDNNTIIPEGTTVTPKGTTTTVPNNTTFSNTSNSSTTPQGAVPSTGSEHTSATAFATPEYPETSPATSTSPVLSTTDFSSTDTAISTTAQNITTLIPEGSTLTTIPGDTSPAVEITFLTTASNSTTVTQEGSTLTTIPGGTTLTIESTFVSTTTTPTIVPTTISPGDTSISPGGTTVIIDATTVSPGGTTLNPDNNTIIPEGTTVTPKGTTTTVPNNTTFSNTSNSSTTPQGAVPSTGSEHTSATAFATPEYPETSPATSTSPVLSTTDFSSTDTAVTPIINTTFYPVTDEITTTYYSPTNTTSIKATTSLSTNINVSSTTLYPTTSENTTTYSSTTTTTDTSTSSLYTNTTSTTTNTMTHVNTTTHTAPTTASPITPNTISTPYTSPSFNTTITTTTTTTTTTSPTTVTLPTTTALKCVNGGKIVNGVCICPDAWTGHTCSVVNFCEAQRLEGFTFPRTPIGWFAYSKEKCEAGTSGSGKPRASARCLLMKKSPRFSPPEIFKCDLTLSDMQNFTSDNLETVATSAQILTSNPEELTAENVTAAAQIANTLLLSANATEIVRVAAVAIVSQLLNATVPNDTEENNTALGLTVTLDQLSVNLSHSINTSQSQVVQPNLVVQSAQIPAAHTQGVQFTSLRGTSGSFVANRIQLKTNVTQVVVENGFIVDALIYLRFPSGEGVRGHQTNSNVSLGFVLYQNDRFFHSKLYTRRRANIRVLSASVRGQEHPVVPEHVEMLFSPRLMDGTSLYDFSCVFWNYAENDWSTSGCSKGNASDGLMRCFCNHTTNFAALWSYRENYEYAEALDVISIVGLSASILGLVVTIIHHIKENFYGKSREQQTNLNSKLALLCIYLSLLAFIITFLSGVQNSSRQNDAEVQIDDQTNDLLDSDERVEPDRGSCTAVAALLHFLLTATFVWNSVYGTQLTLLVRSVRRSLPAHWTPLSVALGWGVPACLTAITLGVSYRVDNPLGYRQEEFCWLAAVDKNKQFSFGKPLFWGFLLPVGLILIYNTVLLVLISMTICKADPKLTSNKESSLRKKFLISFSLAVLLGLSWTLGYLVLLSSGKTHLVFSILFCLCTTTQGLQIFILFTARTWAFRVNVSRSVQVISTLSIPLNSTKYRLRKDWDTNQWETYRDLSDGDTITSNAL